MLMYAAPSAVRPTGPSASEPVRESCEGGGRMERRRGESISRAGAFRRVLRRGDGTRVLELTSTRISRGFFAAHLQAVVAESGLHRGV